MKVKKLISLADEYINTETRKLKSRIKHLKYVLKNLRSREKELELKFKACGKANSKAKKEISNELALIHAYRKKGLKQLKELKKKRKAIKLAKLSDKDKTAD
jgi:hypothetical protein